MPVHEIADRFPMSRPAISKHLRILGDARLVRSQRIAKENVYTINPDAFDEVASWLSGFWSGRLQLLRRLAEGDA